jgi:hypothetical protein
MSATNIKVQIQELFGATVPFADHTGIETAATADAQAAGHRTSTPSAINNATPSSAASTGSSNTARWRPGTTNSLAATRPPSPSPPSTTGYDHFSDTA